MRGGKELQQARPADVVPVGERLPADRDPHAIYLASLAPSGRKAMQANLRTFARTLTAGQVAVEDLPWAALGAQHLSYCKAQWASEGAAPSTINTRLAGVKGVLRAAWLIGLMSTDAYQRAIAIKPASGSRQPAGRALSLGELQALFAACRADRTAAGPRDAALLAILYGTGVRVSELSALQLSDWNADKSRLTILGKGNKQRYCFLSNGSLNALTDWLTVRGQIPGRIFLGIYRSGRINTKSGMSPQSIAGRIKKRAEQAGVKSCSPHDFRRSHISDALDNGADIAAVAANAGHASVMTTAKYDRRGVRAQRKAAATVHVPYVRSQP